MENSLDPISEKAIEWLDSVIGKPIRQLGLIIEDKLKFKRYKNQVDILIKTKEFIKDKQLSPNEIKPKFLADFFENCSWEDDENIQELWARLLAKALTIKDSANETIMYLHILRQLSPKEVEILHKFYMDRFKNGWIPSQYVSIGALQGGNANQASKTSSDIAIDNLVRHNLLRFNNSSTHPTQVRHLVFGTYLGYHFSLACMKE